MSDYTYSLSDGNATITGYTGHGGDITIPSTIDGHPVVAIGDSAFQNNYNLSSFIIPDGIISVGDSAFENAMVYIPVLTLPHSLVTIGERAFAGLNINQVIIDENVVSIGDYAFANCSQVTSVTFRGNAPTIGTNIFGGISGDIIIYYQAGTTGWTNPWQEHVTNEYFPEQKITVTQYVPKNCRKPKDLPKNLKEIYKLYNIRRDVKKTSKKFKW
jgi:hypothetical protein